MRCATLPVTIYSNSPSTRFWETRLPLPCQPDLSSPRSASSRALSLRPDDGKGGITTYRAAVPLSIDVKANLQSVGEFPDMNLPRRNNLKLQSYVRSLRLDELGRCPLPQVRRTRHLEHPFILGDPDCGSKFARSPRIHRITPLVIARGARKSCLPRASRAACAASRPSALSIFRMNTS